MGWIGPDRRTRQIIVRNLRRIKHHSRIEGQKSFRRSQQWIDIYFSDSRLFDNELVEFSEQLLQSPEINRGAAARALERLIDSRSLDHSARQSCVQWRQP